MQSLLQKLNDAGISLTPEWLGPEVYQRENAEWLCSWVTEVLGRKIYCCAYGNFKESLSRYWESVTQEEMTHEEKQKIKEALETAKTENRAAREKHWKDFQPTVESEWNSFSREGVSLYLRGKGLGELYGCRIEHVEGGSRLIVPACDETGKVWGYQRIYGNGDKFFRKGARKEGCFHVLAPPTQGDGMGTLEYLRSAETIYLCEGIATAMSVELALRTRTDSQARYAVVSSFDAGNLLPVARSIRKIAHAKFVFCADNDASRTGELAARKAMGDGDTLRLARPSKGTDFDDVRQEKGLGEVLKQIMEDTKSDEKAGENKPKKKQTKKQEGPSEGEVVDVLIERYKGVILKVEKDIFLFTGTHWDHLDKDAAEDFFARAIGEIVNSKWRYASIMSAYKHFLIYVDNPPKGFDIFAPRPDAVNLRNGTLHFVRAKDGSASLALRPHTKGDLMRNILPYTYDESDTHQNEWFMKALEKIFRGEPDKAEKILAVQEMYACVLCGLYPMLFMLHGVPGTGKSTIANIARRMAIDENISGVPPTLWHGFHMAQMIGKQLNINTDIPINGQIQDDMIKKVIENTPIFVQRKNLTDVKTKLPSCNIFCANGLPKFVEGKSGAQDRRWIVLETKVKVIPESGDYDREIWNPIYESDPQGVFNFAIEGVRRLGQRKGNYTRPASSVETVKNWQTMSDTAGKAFAEFLQDMEEGELDDQSGTMRVEKTRRIKTTVLWKRFADHHKEGSLSYGGPRKPELFDAVERAGFKKLKSEGVWYFEGFGFERALAKDI